MFALQALSFFFFAITASAESVIYLPHDLILKWSFVDDTQMKFEYHVTDCVKEKYDWVGFGFKYDEKGDSMREADIVVVHVDKDLLEDRFAPQNGEPIMDEDLDGQDNVEEQPVTTSEDGMTVFSWYRDYDTGDTEADRLLIEGDPYYILWSVGWYEEDGVTLKRHKINNRGSLLVNLVDGLVDTSSISEESFLTLQAGGCNS